VLLEEERKASLAPLPSNLGKYLGFQIHRGRIKKEDFSSIMDRVSSKLASWKGRLLNKPVRVTLANSVLTAIPAYSMQIQWLPQYVCDHLDKTVHNFIWKGSTNKGMNMVGWEKITKSKKNGGLGVRIARKQNIALLGKLVWDMFKPSNHLLSQILSARYLHGSNIFLTRNSKGSPIWNAIVKALKV